MPTQLMIPARLKSLYDQSTFAPAATLAQQSFLPWLAHFGTNLPLFPEYTDHGINHLNSVLASADALIPQHVFDQNLLTPDDAVLLVLATILHDSAMALTKDQFLALVTSPPVTSGGPAAYPLTAPPLDPAHPDKEKPFPQLFDDFFAEARRWDGRKLANILGTLAPDEKADYPDFLKHPKDLGPTTNWTDRHCRLYGEFVRQNHPRLAHHFALHGLPLVVHTSVCSPSPVVPTPSSAVPPRLPNELPPYLKDLAGLIARSHGITLRDTFLYFSKFGKNKRAVTHHTHPIYLMALLRIADFLQIDHTRGTDLTAVRQLHSPLSQLNWQSHATIEDVAPDEDDAEALNISANPGDAKTFFFIQDLLRGPHGLQQELDITWAVLGQVFSRLTNFGSKDLSKFALTLRRVTSNMDNPETFIKNHNPSYFPYEAKFDIAGPEILDLLVEPLYGRKPEFGVRELLNNSLDAVRELDSYCANRNKNKETLSFPDQQSEVLMKVERDPSNDNWIFTITDKGIGMTTETVRDYFLKAGASFRKSPFWQNEFGDLGKTKVLRSGRFGIGVFAAFLLGDELEIKTRHISAHQNDGIQFKASLKRDSAISLNRIPNCPHGTTIRIVLNPHAAKLLSTTHASDGSTEGLEWDWYAQSYPKVVRMNPSCLRQRWSLPDFRTKFLEPGWHAANHPAFEEIHWTFQFPPFQACNGMFLRPNYSSVLSWPDKISSPFDVPTLSIFDTKGNLPLTLRRDEFVTRSPEFLLHLLPQMMDVFCAMILALASIEPWKGDKSSPSRFQQYHPDGYEPWHRRKVSSLARTEHGSILLHAGCLRQTNIRNLFIIKGEAELPPFNLGGPLTIKNAYRVQPRPDWSADFDLGLASVLLKGSTIGKIPRDMTAALEEFGRSLPAGLIPLSTTILFRGINEQAMPSRPNIASPGTRTQLNDGWIALSNAKSEISKTELEAMLPRSIRAMSTPMEIAFVSFDTAPPNSADAIVEKILTSYFPDPFIPYDIAARKVKFEYAYKKLAPLIAKWEAWKPK